MGGKRKRNLFEVIERLTLAGVMAFSAVPRPVMAFGDSPAPVITVSGFEFSGSNYCSVETTNSNDYGPTVGDDGYMGTFSWSYSTTTGTGTAPAFVVWEVDYYGADGWEVYHVGQTPGSYGASVSGTSYLDFYLGNDDPAGFYQFSAWVCTGTASGSSSWIGGSTGSYACSAFDDDPFPDPEPSPGPYPGGDPPITHPELPPTAPIGPGSSSWCEGC